MRNSRICDSLACINVNIFKIINEHNKELGLDITPVQESILLCIYKSNRDFYQKEIEEFVTCNKSTLSSVLDTMEKNGLIIRQIQENDSRKKLIKLTNKGIEISNILCNDSNYIEDKLCHDINEKDIEKFLDILDKMKSNLERE